MAKGRPAKSIKELKAKGTYTPSRHAARVELKPVQHLAPPDWYDDDHRDLWTRTVQSLVDFEILAKQHFDSIRLYVETLIIQRRALDDFTANGMTITLETRGGTSVRVNPSFNIYKECDRILKPLREQFGFTPRALQGMKTREGGDGEQTHDPMAEFLSGPPTKPRAEA